MNVRDSWKYFSHTLHFAYWHIHPPINLLSKVLMSTLEGVVYESSTNLSEGLISGAELEADDDASAASSSSHTNLSQTL